MTLISMNGPGYCRIELWKVFNLAHVCMCLYSFLVNLFFSWWKSIIVCLVTCGPKRNKDWNCMSCIEPKLLNDFYVPKWLNSPNDIWWWHNWRKIALGFFFFFLPFYLLQPWCWFWIFTWIGTVKWVFFLPSLLIANEFSNSKVNWVCFAVMKCYWQVG